MLSMYALGTLSAFGLAWLFKRTLLKGPAPAFILEMPPYRVPKAAVVLRTVGQRCWSFLKRAGTVIFALSVMMWAGTHYPQPAKYSRDYDGQIAQVRSEIDAAKGAPAGQLNAQKFKIEELQNAQAQEVLNNSAAGRVGRFIAPVFKPLGYDWKLSIGVTGAFFAREVIVSTLGVVYSVGKDTDETSTALMDHIRGDYSALVGVSLMVFVVFCMQCLSTLAVVRKETGHWGWSAFMFVYMTAMAWVAAFVVYQGGGLLLKWVHAG
jgi:ferrous iron transport protein B